MNNIGFGFAWILLCYAGLVTYVTSQSLECDSEGSDFTFQNELWESIKPPKITEDIEDVAQDHYDSKEHSSNSNNNIDRHNHVNNNKNNEHTHDHSIKHDVSYHPKTNTYEFNIPKQNLLNDKHCLCTSNDQSIILPDNYNVEREYSNDPTVKTYEFNLPPENFYATSNTINTDNGKIIYDADIIENGVKSNNYDYILSGADELNDANIYPYNNENNNVVEMDDSENDYIFDIPPGYVALKDKKLHSKTENSQASQKSNEQSAGEYDVYGVPNNNINSHSSSIFTGEESAYKPVKMFHEIKIPNSEDSHFYSTNIDNNNQMMEFNTRLPDTNCIKEDDSKSIIRKLSSDTKIDPCLFLNALLHTPTEAVQNYDTYHDLKSKNINDNIDDFEVASHIVKPASPQILEMKGFLPDNENQINFIDCSCYGHKLHEPTVHYVDVFPDTFINTDTNLNKEFIKNDLDIDAMDTQISDSLNGHITPEICECKQKSLNSQTVETIENSDSAIINKIQPCLKSLLNEPTFFENVNILPINELKHSDMSVLNNNPETAPNMYDLRIPNAISDKNVQGLHFERQPINYSTTQQDSNNNQNWNYLSRMLPVQTQLHENNIFIPIKEADSDAIILAPDKPDVFKTQIHDKTNILRPNDKELVKNYANNPHQDTFWLTPNTPQAWYTAKQKHNSLPSYRSNVEISYPKAKGNTEFVSKPLHPYIAGNFEHEVPCISKLNTAFTDTNSNSVLDENANTGGNGCGHSLPSLFDAVSYPYNSKKPFFISPFPTLPLHHSSAVKSLPLSNPPSYINDNPSKLSKSPFISLNTLNLGLSYPTSMERTEGSANYPTGILNSHYIPINSNKSGNSYMIPRIIEIEKVSPSKLDRTAPIKAAKISTSIPVSYLAKNSLTTNSALTNNHKNSFRPLANTRIVSSSYPIAKLDSSFTIPSTNLKTCSTYPKFDVPNTDSYQYNQHPNVLIPESYDNIIGKSSNLAFPNLDGMSQVLLNKLNSPLNLTSTTPYFTTPRNLEIEKAHVQNLESSLHVSDSIETPSVTSNKTNLISPLKEFSLTRVIPQAATFTKKNYAPIFSYNTRISSNSNVCPANAIFFSSRPCPCDVATLSPSGKCQNIPLLAKNPIIKPEHETLNDINLGTPSKPLLANTTVSTSQPSFPYNKVLNLDNVPPLFDITPPLTISQEPGFYILMKNTDLPKSSTVRHYKIANIISKPSFTKQYSNAIPKTIPLQTFYNKPQNTSPLSTLTKNSSKGIPKLNTTLVGLRDASNAITFNIYPRTMTSTDTENVTTISSLPWTKPETVNIYSGLIPDYSSTVPTSSLLSTYSKPTPSVNKVLNIIPLSKPTPFTAYPKSILTSFNANGRSVPDSITSIPFLIQVSKDINSSPPFTSKVLYKLPKHSPATVYSSSMPARATTHTLSNIGPTTINSLSTPLANIKNCLFRHTLQKNARFSSNTSYKSNSNLPLMAIYIKNSLPFRVLQNTDSLRFDPLYATKTRLVPFHSSEKLPISTFSSTTAIPKVNNLPFSPFVDYRSLKIPKQSKLSVTNKLISSTLSVKGKPVSTSPLTFSPNSIIYERLGVSKPRSFTKGHSTFVPTSSTYAFTKPLARSVGSLFPSRISSTPSSLISKYHCARNKNVMNSTPPLYYADDDRFLLSKSTIKEPSSPKPIKTTNLFSWFPMPKSSIPVKSSIPSFSCLNFIESYTPKYTSISSAPHNLYKIIATQTKSSVSPYNQTPLPTLSMPSLEISKYYSQSPSKASTCCRLNQNTPCNYIPKFEIDNLSSSLLPQSTSMPTNNVQTCLPLRNYHSNLSFPLSSFFKPMNFIVPYSTSTNIHSSKPIICSSNTEPIITTSKPKTLETVSFPSVISLPRSNSLNTSKTRFQRLLNNVKQLQNRDVSSLQITDVNLFASIVSTSSPSTITSSSKLTTDACPKYFKSSRPSPVIIHTNYNTLPAFSFSGTSSTNPTVLMPASNNYASNIPTPSTVIQTTALPSPNLVFPYSPDPSSNYPSFPNKPVPKPTSGISPIPNLLNSNLLTFPSYLETRQVYSPFLKLHETLSKTVCTPSSFTTPVVTSQINPLNNEYMISKKPTSFSLNQNGLSLPKTSNSFITFSKKTPTSSLKGISRVSNSFSSLPPFVSSSFSTNSQNFENSLNFIKPVLNASLQSYRQNYAPLLKTANDKISPYYEYIKTNDIDITKTRQPNIYNTIPNISKLITPEILKNFKNSKLNIGLNDIGIVKYKPNREKEYIIETNNPGIELKAWPSRIVVLKPRIVIEATNYEVLNFLPIVKHSKYDFDKVQDLAKSIVEKNYGSPIVLKAKHTDMNSFTVVDNITKKCGDKCFIVWPTYRDYS